MLHWKRKPPESTEEEAVFKAVKGEIQSVSVVSGNLK